LAGPLLDVPEAALPAHLIGRERGNETWCARRSSWMIDTEARMDARRRGFWGDLAVGKGSGEGECLGLSRRSDPSGHSQLAEDDLL
jgi:hypothetical protein